MNGLLELLKRLDLATAGWKTYACLVGLAVSLTLFREGRISKDAFEISFAVLSALAAASRAAASLRGGKSAPPPPPVEPPVDSGTDPA